MEDLEQFQKTLQVMCKNLTDYESKEGIQHVKTTGWLCPAV